MCLTIIDRSIAPIRAESLPVAFQLSENGNLKETEEVVLKLMSDGDITPDQANTILGALNAQCRIIEIADIERRLELLEQCKKSQDQQ